MSFLDIVKSDFDLAVNSEFGNSAVYTPVGGVARTISVAVTDRKTVEDYDSEQQRSEVQLTTFCANSSVDGIDDPKKHDKLVLDSVTWRFKSIVSVDESGVTVSWTASQDVSTRSN